jgi:acid stress-induced BolA-like protein IbaG/YrbA
MSMLGTGGTLTDAVRTAILETIPEAEVDVSGSGGHFTIRVVSSAFEGKSMLQKQRLVMRAVAPFMSGDDAPVHAIDNLQTLLPE